MGQSLYQKVLEAHQVRELPGGQMQMLVDLHLIHEVTSPQAFAMIEERGLPVAWPDHTFATVDHIIPTHNQNRPLGDGPAEEMLQALEANTQRHGIRFFHPDKGEQGIVHVIGPERGLTQPGMTICCGDSHTSTHGAFGALAFGIGTSQVRDVLATQTLRLTPLKVRRIQLNGKRPTGVFAKDLILAVIAELGVKGGIGFAYEYAGDAVEACTMEERLTLCNMSIEGGAQCGYVNPDASTFAYLKGRPYAPAEKDWEKAVARWEGFQSDPDAHYDDIVEMDAADISPMITWGLNPGQAMAIDGRTPRLESLPREEQAGAREALQHMGWEENQPLLGEKIDVAFLGSCTNGRFSDLAPVAERLKRGDYAVAPHVRALVVPGSQQVKRELEAQGYDRVFRDAGFEFREAGCSMCLAMNPDKLQGRELCASSSNRNFKGRQGSPEGRTLLMSPMNVAAAAIEGRVADGREVFDL